MRQHLIHILCVAACIVATHAGACGTKKHAENTVVPASPAAVSALLWNIGGPFQLVDHTGAARSQFEPEGKLQLLFFGYANCPGICSAALPMMADAVDVLADRGIEASPVLITIDPVLDTVETMGPKLHGISPAFVGLTGDSKDLNVAYDAYQVTFEKIMDDPEHGSIYAHGSHIYLLDAQGEVLTLMPPILPAEQVAEIVARYVEE